MKTKPWGNIDFIFSSLVWFSAFSPDLCGFNTLSYFMEIFSPLTPALWAHFFFCFAEPAWAVGGRYFPWQSRGHGNFSSDSAQSEPHRVGLAVTSYIVTAPYNHTGFQLCSLQWVTGEKWGAAAPNFHCFSASNVFNFWGPFLCSFRFKCKIPCFLHMKTNNYSLLLNSLQEPEHCFSNADRSVFPQGRKIIVYIHILTST